MSERDSYKKVDEILGNEHVLNEYTKAMSAVRKLRQNGCDPTGIKFPKLKFLNSFNAVVYDPRRQEMFIGPWDKMHFDIAADSNINWTPMPNSLIYYSCHSFSLKSRPYDNVLMLDTLTLFKPEDLTAINNYNYHVMSPTRHWLTRPTQDTINYIAVPSVLYPDSV